MHKRSPAGYLATCVVIGLGTGCVGAAAPQYRVLYEEHIPAADAKTPNTISFSTPANLRLGFVRRTSDKKEIYCAEPMPDVAMGMELSGALSGSTAAALNASMAQAALSKSESEDVRRTLEELRVELERVRDGGAADADTKADSAQTERISRLLRQIETSMSSSSSESSSANVALMARLSASVSELGGRTQQVLLAREFLYRICEAAANEHISPTEFAGLQREALKVVDTVAASQRQSTNAENLQAAGELIKQVNAYNGRLEAKCESEKPVCQAENVKKPAEQKVDCDAVVATCKKNLTLQPIPKLPDISSGTPSK